MHNNRILTTAILSLATLAAAGQVRSVRDMVPADTLLSMLRRPNVATDKPVEIRSIVTHGPATIRVRLTDNAAQLPLTTAQIATVGDSLRHWCKMPAARVVLLAGQADLTQQALVDTATCGTQAKGSPVRRTDPGFGGPLTGRNIALWPSHGRYYEAALERWEWQRGRLLTTVEDLLTPSFVLPFLIPMLENAGAMVLCARERDTSAVSVVVDDEDGPQSFFSTKPCREKVPGFGRHETLRGLANPFRMGKGQVFDMTEADSITFRGIAPASGLMTTYIAYPQATPGAAIAQVTVRHAEGEAHYEIDQTMGGGMWVPLGTLPYREGREWEIVIRGRGEVTADAIRIGGGMGRVERAGGTSGMPAWAEAARYYLQGDGFDHEKVLSISQGQNEYADDINCRGEWVNALVGSKRIPIDLSLALHTDAGVTGTDSVVGTLALITTKKGDGRLPDGRPRMTSRQMAGRVTTSLEADIRRTWNKDWTMRGIADKGYSESRRPDVPALLLELLSHQNVADMGFALHPAFRHDAARAIYKGLLRYLEGDDAPVCPLAPSKVGLRFAGRDSLMLQWSATPDTLERTAVANTFEVFDGERLVCSTTDTFAVLSQPKDGVVRIYRIVAVGPGGRSLPSEGVPACLWNGLRRGLLVEGMDRLAAPATIVSPQWAGILTSQDPGAPWHNDIFSTGEQHNFDPNSAWTDDDAPGCGASHADREMAHWAGAAVYSNEPSAVAIAMRQEGYSFVGVTKRFFDADTIEGQDTTTYALVRINLDRQRSTPYGDAGARHSIYTDGFRRHVATLAHNGTRIVVSGSFVGSDIGDEATSEWCATVLGIRHRTGHATRTFRVNASPRWTRDNCIGEARRQDIWHQEADAIEPARPGAKTVCRYTDTWMSAAVEYGNVAVVGF